MLASRRCCSISRIDVDLAETNVQRFKLAGRMVSAMRAFRASGFTHKHHDGGADAKADSKADAAVAALAAKGDAPADEKK